MCFYHQIEVSIIDGDNKRVHDLVTCSKVTKSTAVTKSVMAMAIIATLVVIIAVAYCDS